MYLVQMLTVEVVKGDTAKERSALLYDDSLFFFICKNNLFQKNNLLVFQYFMIFISLHLAKRYNVKQTLAHREHHYLQLSFSSM